MPTARTNGIELTYETLGEGAPLVLVAGIGMQLVSWPVGFLEKLAARGFRVITFDNRDVGMSTKLDAAGVPPLLRLIGRSWIGLPVTAPYTLFDMAADVAGLLDELALEKAHVAGVSLGGMVAQAFAIAHPERAASLTSMMSSSGGRRIQGDPRAAMLLLRRPPRSREEAVRYHLEFFRTVGSTRFSRDDAALAERSARAYDRCHHPPGFARQFAAAVATGDMRPRLAGVRAPTLVLHGSSDKIFYPMCGRDTARAIPGASFRLIEGWGHDLAEGAWDLLADAIARHALGAKAA